MIKNEKAISDMELDMVVGGATSLILKKNEEGKINAFVVNDTKVDMVTSGNEVIDYKETGAESTFKNIDPDRLNDFIDYVKGLNPDVKIIWSK